MKGCLYRTVLAVAIFIHAVNAGGQVVALQVQDSDEVVIGNPLVELNRRDIR